MGHAIVRGMRWNEIKTARISCRPSGINKRPKTTRIRQSKGSGKFRKKKTIIYDIVNNVNERR
jgi:hypothetical protein